MFPTWLKIIDDIASGALLVQRITAVVQPSGLANPILATLAALGSILSLVILTGVAISSVVFLLAATLGLYFLVTEILGLSIEVSIPN